MPLLLTLDPSQHHDIIFSYDAETQSWIVRFEQRREEPQGQAATKTRRKGGAQ
jgi:hypothetical protein